MIAIFVNSMNDTDTFSSLFDGIDCTFLYNPTRKEVEDVLTERPTETLLCLGHGSSNGLFNTDLSGYLIDDTMGDLLRTREIIGIWCYASTFACLNGLKGFFTYMFISNSNECQWHSYNGHTDEVVFEQNRKFANRVNELIKEERPMDEWVNILYEGSDHDIDFVNFNYSNLSYYDGVENDLREFMNGGEEYEDMSQAESYLLGKVYENYTPSDDEIFLEDYIEVDVPIEDIDS